MRYSFLFVLILCLASKVEAKKHLLTYAFSDGQTIEYNRTDSIHSVMLVGGLGNNSRSTMQSSFSITHVSDSENKDLHLVLNFASISLLSVFNGQETLRLKSGDTQRESRLKRTQEILNQLTALSFPFRITANGTPIEMPELEKYCDSLKFSQNDKRTLELILNQSHLEKIITQTFPELPVEKIKDEYAWKETSMGAIHVPFRLSVQEQLNIDDKYSFSLTSKGSHKKIQESSIDLGNVVLNVKIKAHEKGKRSCNLETSFTQKLNYTTTINGDLADSSEQNSSTQPSVVYTEKVLLIKK